MALITPRGIGMHAPNPIDTLRTIVGADEIITTPSELEYYGHDVYAAGAPLLAVLRPASVDSLQAALRALRDSAVAVVPRGGGMSYTGGYLASRPDTVLVDLARLDRILEVNLEDMYVTVEAGITWRALDEALAPQGVRPRFWGPLSGLHATVGGSLSQGSAFLGTGVHGISADNVLGLELVTVDGELVRTGSAAGGGRSAFFRHHGPDLTGLFTGDCGAFGCKVRATLPLVRRHAALETASFAFADAAALLQTMGAIARDGLATECFAFDAGLQSLRMKRASLLEDVKSLGRVVGGTGSVLTGLRQGAKVVLGGRSFLDDAGCSLHLAFEGRTAAEARERAAAAQALAEAAGGQSVPNTVPTVLRSSPFANITSLLGPEGERWVPVHGVLPMSRATEAYDAALAVFDRHAAAMSRLDIKSGVLMCTVGAQGMIVEPCLYWPGEQPALHRRVLPAGYLAKLPQHEHSPEIAGVVDQIRHELRDALEACGAVHFQIGKFYRYASTLDPATLALVSTVKQALDPRGRMNPGALEG
jgi:FAD/FMN-containing dehydrogenase